MFKDITSFIKYDKFYEICSCLNQLKGNNKFSCSILSYQYTILQLVYIGKIFNYNCYLPLNHLDLANFLIFNINAKYKNENLFQLANTIFLVNQTMIISKKKLKVIQKNLSKSEKDMFMKYLTLLNNQLPFELIKTVKDYEY